MPNKKKTRPPTLEPHKAGAGILAAMSATLINLTNANSGLNHLSDSCQVERNICSSGHVVT